MVSKKTFMLILRIVAWAICAFLAWGAISHLLSQPSTFDVTLGMVLLIAFICITVMTNFFTSFGLKDEDKENEDNKVNQV